MSPQNPSPSSSASSDFGASGAGRLAADLDPSERAVAERLGALPRAGLPRGLRALCLQGGLVGGLEGSLEGGLAQAASRLPREARARHWTLAFSAAAALLLALGVASLVGSSGGAGPTGTAPAGASFASLHVVDDPSVPLFHGLETFDQLAGSVLASAVESGSRSGR